MPSAVSRSENGPAHCRPAHRRVRKLLAESPADPRIQAGLAEAFIQKLRETTDFAYLNRASALVEKMLAADPKSYDGLRLSAEIETHRHNFPKAAQLPRISSTATPAIPAAWACWAIP
jgi:hypothetical protein